MAGKRIVAICGVLLSVLLLFMASGANAAHPNHPGTPNKLEFNYAVYISTTAANANPDRGDLFLLNLPNQQFSAIYSYASPPEWKVAMGSGITLGAKVGKITSLSTLSLLNNPCRTAMRTEIPFLNASTDVTKTIAWDPKGGHARDLLGAGCTGGPDGLPDYVDCYPDWILNTFDPDGAGPLPSLTPRARYAGHEEVAANAPPTILQFLIFSPEQLSLLPKPMQEMGDTLGYPNYVILDNPGGALAPSSITDFCTTNMNDTFLQGLSGKKGLMPDNPAVANAQLLPFEWQAGGECDGTDNDLDTVIDDGCIGYTGANLNEVRSTSPAVNTGIWAGGAQTGTHLTGSYLQAERDIDWDGISNHIDPCPLDPDNDNDGTNDNIFQKSAPYDDIPWDPWLNYNSTDPPNQGDPDNDGIPSACDPTPSENVNAGDQDNDGFQNRQDICPLIQNGCKNAACGAIWNAAWDNQADQDTTPGSAAADFGPIKDDIGDSCDNGDWDGAFGRLGAGKVTEWECNDYTGGANEDCTATPAKWVLKANRADGDYFKDMMRTADCIGEADTDGDGWCDTTENGLGSLASNVGNPGNQNPASKENVNTWFETSCPGYTGTGGTVLRCMAFTCSDSVDNDGDGAMDGADAGCSTPEHVEIDVVLDPVQTSCSDGVDNDKDGLMDAAELDGPDPDANLDCAAVQAGDSDADGVPDAKPDNCTFCKNPEQLNTNAAGGGDACDPDDDGDLWYDITEWKAGSDAKSAASVPAGDVDTDTDTDLFKDNKELFLGTDPNDNCPDVIGADDAWPLDISMDKVVRMDDVLNFAGKLKQQTCQAGYSKRLDFSADGVLRMDDVLNFAGKLKQTCT